ncbi:MAG: ligand-binding sensor domain-containing protein, partial [Flavisolibacter sp.]
RYAKKTLEFADGIFINPYEMLLACENEVLLFDTRNKTFYEIPVFDENNLPVSISRVENAATDKKGNFMIMSRTGIFFFDPVSKTCQRKTSKSPDLSSFNKYEIFNILEDSRAYYWIATNKKGLIRFDPAKKTITTIPLPAPLKIETLRFDVVTEDSKGNIWAGSSSGLFRIDPVTLASTFFSSNASADVHLSHPEVNVITEDRNKILWIGTVGGGINKMIPFNSGFKNILLANNKEGRKIGTYFMGLQQVKNDIWFMNIWDQVGKINMQTGKASLISEPMIAAGYSWYSEGTVIRNQANGLTVLNGEASYSIIQNPNGQIAVQSQSSPGLSHIYHAKNNKTWYMVKTAVEKTFQRNDTIYGNQFFYDALEDNAGNIWIGSSSGLIQFKIAENKFEFFQHDDKRTNSISSNFIYGLEIDNNQTIWAAAYNGGLCAFHIPSKTFRNYSKEDGLADNIVYSIEKDHHGNFWFSTNAGISAYNTNTKAFRNYGVADGLLNAEFNRRSSFKNEQGWIFFGGISGIDYFHPDSIIKNNSNPNLAFTSFRIFNSDFVPDDKNQIPVIELNPRDKYLTVDFASLEFSDQQKIQYEYRINNNPWIRTGTQRTLSFSDLATGNHHLYVRSTNSEGIWLNNIIHCLIIVHPSWWQTWWFRAGVAVLLILFLIAGIRFYYRRKLEKQKNILEKQQAIEKERTRIATDMHDDLGAGLSRIKFLSETIGIKKQKEQPIEEDVTRIREYAHQMIDKMGEIVWALNEKNDSLSDLIAFTRAYSIEYLLQNGIECEVYMPEEVEDRFVSGEFRRNIFLSVKEILHNVVKHAQASKVIIRIQTADMLHISIQDDGKGFEQSLIRRYSNGLNNIDKRMKDIGGKTKIKGDEGTLVYLEAPLKR